MSAKIFGFIATCIILATTQVNGLELETVNGRIKITVGTASGCSDTWRFITNQLGPAYDLYGEFLDIEFVPWGRTQWLENGTFICQFLENDCWANRLHRCVLNKLKDDQDAQMHYMRCEFETPYPAFLQGSYQCAQSVGINLVDVDYCVTHPGDELDRAAQQASVEPMAVINFVPYLVLNDVMDRDFSNQARLNLISMICFALAEDPSTGVISCVV